MYSESNIKELIKLDKQYVWHPFTQMSDWLEEEPLIVDKGEGCTLIDIQGNRYLDGVSSLWVNVHGHRRAEIDQAVIDQLGRIAHSTFLGLSNTPAVKLAKELVNIMPSSLAKVFYSDNGSTGVEIALKMAFQYWQQCQTPQPAKTRFISLVNGYHGDTIGSVSVGGMDLFHRIYRPLLFDTLKVRAPYCYRCHLGKAYPQCDMICLGEMEETMERHHQEVAAVVVEPLIQGAGGMVTFPEGYTRKVRDLAKKFNILFIADEVATGFGRTGKLFACQHEGIEPDIMVAAKGITGGYLPLAVTVTTQGIFDGFYGEYGEQKTFFHGHTYTANPLACTAALANLEIFRKEETIDILQDKIVILEQGLESFLELEHVGDIRQLGFMVGIELVADRETRIPYPYEEKIGIKVIQEARKQGLVIRPLENVVVLTPPLSISPEELRILLNITFHSIRKVTEG
jgi:adenosylmethionine-8-amino-7-oxononanoate aminotransferase